MVQHFCSNAAAPTHANVYRVVLFAQTLATPFSKRSRLRSCERPALEHVHDEVRLTCPLHATGLRRVPSFRSPRKMPPQARVHAPLAVECQGGGREEVVGRCAPLLCTKHASFCTECSVLCACAEDPAMLCALHTRAPNPKPAALGRALTTVCAQVARVLGNFRRRF